MSDQESFKLILISITLLAAMAGVMVIMIVLLVPITELFAIPTYATMIFIEKYTSRKNWFPNFLKKHVKFKRPKSILKRSCMSAFAMCASAALVTLLLLLIFSYKTTRPDAISFFVHGAFPWAVGYWLCLIMTYVVSNFIKDESGPMDDLVTMLPAWLLRVIGKAF